MKKLSVAALLVLAGAASAQGATVAAYWRFPTTVPASADNFKFTPPILADVKVNAGVAQATYDGATWNGNAAATGLDQGNLQYFTGSTINAQGGDAAGSGLSIRNNTGANGEGKSLTFQADLTGFAGISMSFAERVTSTGPANVAVSISTDGMNFTPVAVANYAPVRDATFRLQTIDLSSQSSLDNAATAYIRLTFTGYGATSTTGAIRIDNVTIVPGASSMALLGLGGLIAARRRRA